MASEQKQVNVSRRRVFYIPGYDPFPPRRYRELYRTESAAQAQISGYTMSQIAKTGPYSWSVSAEIEGQKSAAEIEVLIWSDIVRASMATGIFATYLQLLRTAWVYLSTGALRRLMLLRKGPVIAALYPVGMLLAQLGLAVLVGWFMGRALTGGLAMLLPLPDWLNVGLGGAWGIVVFVALLRWFRAQDGKLFAYYLMHDYAFAARWRGANPPALEARMAEFGAKIAAALEEDLDEVLVVGHSSGAHLAVSVLADVIRARSGAERGAGQVGRDGPALGFLSLGQVVPMMSFLPEAQRLRGDLNFLANSDALSWVDVTAPGDGCAFALCDPVSVSGVEPEGKRWPLVFSAAFTQSLSEQTWRALRWRFFRLHFQYLCAFDQPKDYDYFQITAGPLTLAQRYDGRPQSRSRIDIAVSRHRSMAA